jgi:hypothetical protein
MILRGIGCLFEALRCVDKANFVNHLKARTKFVTCSVHKAQTVAASVRIGQHLIANQYLGSRFLASTSQLRDVKEIASQFIGEQIGYRTQRSFL